MNEVKHMELSIVIPMYKSEKTIKNVIDEINLELERVGLMDYEVVIVNDCSPDDALEIVKLMAKNDKRIKIIDLAKNSGQAAALMAGYKFAAGDYIVNMDDDFQHPAEEIWNMLGYLKSNDLDVVFANYLQKKQSKFRLIGSYINYIMTEFMTDKPKGIKTNSFFIMRRFVCREIIQYNIRSPYIYGIIFAATSKIGNININHRVRLEGVSNYSLLRLLSLWFSGFISFSIKPIRVFTLLGFVLAVIAIITAILTAILRLLEPDVAPLGWTSVIVAILFFSGVQLISIGLLGEYLGRLYITNSKLPTAVIRETYNIINLNDCEEVGDE